MKSHDEIKGAQATSDYVERAERRKAKRFDYGKTFNEAIRTHARKISDPVERKECIAKLYHVYRKYQNACDRESQMDGAMDMAEAFKRVAEGLKQIDGSHNNFALSVAVANRLPQHPELRDLSDNLVSDIVSALVAMGEEAEPWMFPSFNKTTMRLVLVHLLAELHAICLRYGLRSGHTKEFTKLAQALVDCIVYPDGKVDRFPKANARSITDAIRTVEETLAFPEFQGMTIPPQKPPPPPPDFGE